MLHITREVFRRALLIVLLMVPTVAMADGHSSPTGLAPEIAAEADAGAKVEAYHVPYQADVFLALAIFGIALLVARWLSHARPGRRVLGTFLAAAMTLGIGLTIWWLIYIGELDTLRPFAVPTDQTKTLQMNLFGWAFTLSGLFLLLVTYWQTRRDDVLDLGSRNEEARYGKTTRALHWTTAILFILLVPMGVFMSMVPEDTWYRHAYYVVHKSLGLTVLLLVLIRLFWHRMSPTPSLDASLKNWEKRSAHFAHIILYVFMIGFPLTGVLLSIFAGKFISFYFLSMSFEWAENRNFLLPAGLMHKMVLPILFYATFAAHVAGALKHRYVDGHDDAFKRIAS